MGADARLLLPGEACVVCLGGLRNLDEARYEVAGPPKALHRGRRSEWNEQRAGSLVTINEVAVNLSIQLWLDLLTGIVRQSRWCRLEWDLEGTPRMEIRYGAATACDVCQRGP
jgi:hypothetical protein